MEVKCRKVRHLAQGIHRQITFKILVNELQSLGLKVTVEDAKGDEIDLRDKDEDYLEDEAQRRRSQLRQREEYDALP